jgi:uncharacterized YccA/Bax inhibitor family protein
MNLTNMRSTNPAIGVMNRAAGTFNFGGEGAEANAATVSGTTTKALALIAGALVVGWLSMAYTMSSIVAGQGISGLLLYGSLIVGLIAAVVTCFKPEASPFTAPLYSVCEGACLGALSGVFEFKYPGIVSTAVMSTFVVVMVMLALWKFHVIVPTQRFRAVVMSATLGVCVLYLVDLVFHLFGSALLPTTGSLAIGISLIVCLIASMNLILDFDSIQTSVDQGLPKYFEYFNAFSLLVTICWLYIEILQLLAQREE